VLSTLVDHREKAPVYGIGNAWTRTHYGGDFGLSLPPESGAALSLVFVQSRNGNTGAADPSSLGGGATDQHLIYEGLSRVAADAVLAGAGTIHAESFFSVWHPELVALRRTFGLPRHPAQIVVSKRGRIDFNALLFDRPDVPVLLIAEEAAMSARAAWLRARPWIRHVSFVADDLRPVIVRLRDEESIRRVSVVGGRFTASRLVDAGLVQDLYLTTTPRDGGEPGTPWYSGATAPRLDVITKKEWTESGSTIVFEHILVRRPQSP
jgi:riboflavin biosynthesis pyrimidine reductase